MEGSLDLTMPYNADELLAMFKDAYGRDDMVLSGTHVWDDSMAGTNGTGVRATETVFEKSGLEIPAIFEIEVTKVDNPDDNYTFEQFDISKLVSEAMNHVAQGGVISMSTHFANPYGPERYINGSWYGLVHGR
ncbi:MAG: hypothetical protein E7671_02160 [Ruminococcaceae bacterium]|nr:hypothetical protein [Oscillospiraceae bacterium]